MNKEKYLEILEALSKGVLSFEDASLVIESSIKIGKIGSQISHQPVNQNKTDSRKDSEEKEKRDGLSKEFNKKASDEVGLRKQEIDKIFKDIDSFFDKCDMMCSSINNFDVDKYVNKIGKMKFFKLVNKVKEEKEILEECNLNKDIIYLKNKLDDMIERLTKYNVKGSNSWLNSYDIKW